MKKIEGGNMFIPEEHYTEIGSVRTCYWAEGEGSPVLLIHGLGGAMTGWLPTIPALMKEHRVYAMDLPGHGRTAKPTDTKLCAPVMAQFVQDFMSAMKIERAKVVGHSMGGAVALNLTIGHPERVERLVLADAAALGPEATWMFRMISVPGLGELLSKQSYTPDVKKFAQTVRANSKNPAAISDDLIEVLHRWEQSPTGYITTLELLRSGGNILGQKRSFYGPMVEKLGSIQIPVLVLWGREDVVVPVVQGERAVKKLPNGRLQVIEDCGHVPMFDQPEQFNQAVVEFLRD